MPVTPAQLARQRRHAQKGGAIGFPVFNPPAGLWIGGVDYSRLLVQFSARVRSTISPYAGTFHCDLDGPAATLQAVKVEQELTYNRDGVQYAGVVRSIVPVDQVIASANVTLQLDAQDFTTLLDRDICAYGVSAPQIMPVRGVIESDVQRINWLVQSFGRVGMSMHHVQQNYVAIPATDYSGMTLRAAIESVLAYSGASYYVDYVKDLHCFLDEKQYAPFSLSETPDNVASFPYGGLGLPTDSIDLRNAVYGVPGAIKPSAPNLASVTATPVDGSPPAGTDPLVMASFKAASRAPISLIAAGPFTIGAPNNIQPAWLQPTRAGSLLIAWVEGTGNVLLAGSSGAGNDLTWVCALQRRTSNGRVCAIFYKANSGQNEYAPTFTCSVGLTSMRAQVAEFAGASTISPLEQIGVAEAIAPSTISFSCGDLDSALGNLVILNSHWLWSFVTNPGFSATVNGVAATTVGDDSGTAQANHSYHAYCIVPSAVSTWYVDEASVALYGRRETSFSDTTITTQADLDAKGAAVLAANTQPRREGAFRCWQPGLAVGQRFTIQSSLYAVPVTLDPLGNYSGVVQSVEVSYPNEMTTPEWAIEFIKPAVTLAAQLRNISSPSAVVASAAALPVTGTLGYAEVKATQGTFTAETDITGLVVNVDVQAGRRIRVMVKWGASSSVAGDIVTARIKEGTTTLQSDDVTIPTAGAGMYKEFSVVLQPSTGAHSYKVTMLRAQGTGNVTSQAGTGDPGPAYILVEDIGV